MIDTAIVVGIIRILFVCIIITAAYIISSRNLLSVVSVYALQSLTLVGIALALWSLEGSLILLAIAAVTFISKVIIIPYFIATIQEKIRIKRDIEFHYLDPTSSLLISMALMLVIYLALTKIMQETPARESLFFFGAVLGISLMLMGMMVTFSRKRAITKVLGFLSMENGVLLFGMFVTDIPFIIEFLIIIDLIILVILTAILSVGIDSTLEDYHKHLHRFHLLEESEDVAMILIAFVLVSVVSLVIIATTQNHRQMNTVCIAQALFFAILAAWIAVFQEVPVVSFLVGSQYLFIDHLGLFEVLIATVIFACAAVYARGYVEGLLESGELEKGSLRLFYAAWALLLLVIVLAFFSDNLALFWIFAELTTIISAMLIAILAARENIDAAIKYIFIASVSMLFAFVGFIFLFEVSRVHLGTGTLNWTVLIQHAAAFSPGMVIASFVLVFVGFAAKHGIFPFHTWLPEAHAKAPSAVSAILSGVLLNVGIYGIIRMYAIVHQTTAIATIAPMLTVFGILTIGIAALSMLPQKNLKKLVAF